MFEVIGIAVVCWIVFVLIRGFFRASSKVRSKEYGTEARHIAVRQLGVPEQYHNHMTTTKIEAIKNTAILLRDSEDEFKRCSWPRLLSLVIYGEFHKDCEQWQLGNPISEQLFIRLRITSEMITKELERNPSEVIYGNT